MHRGPHTARSWALAVLALLAAVLVGATTTGPAVAAGAGLSVAATDASPAGSLPCGARFHRPAHHDGSTLPEAERSRPADGPPGPALTVAVPAAAPVPDVAAPAARAVRQRLYLLHRRLLLAPHVPVPLV